MLPHFTKTKAVAAMTITALVLATAAPANAWGRREKDTLTGVLGAILVGTIINQATHQPRVQPQPQPTPVYVPPAPVSVYHTPAAAAFNVYSDNAQRRIQSTLSAYGYYHGSIDGSFGQGTYAATLAYAKATGNASLMNTVAGASSIYDDLLF